MRFTILMMGLSMIFGSLMILMALPEYTPDIIRLLFLMIPIVTTIGIIVKA